ncbi:FAD-dependent oxidoreductase [Flavobacterium granuli]|uniref:Glycine/D-amino acid oxidase-like deaminating enzyme n=1 Tax=Flavobacterium granuli TaxID=280093 RepID=A0ABU1S0G8_9FLAO|nr:FAD-dependent oxidoreductase [Flavobacterium granuli]MDR6843680.1 glycine/D-amino acid oxidase-like deaminating enzyme [Flavobacterium granuli]
MKLHSTETFWPLKNSMANGYPSLQDSIATPILIIGGGITGALIAYELIRQGKKAVLVDKRDVCNGSTAASTALLQYEIDVSLHELIKKRGLKCAVDSYKNCKKAIYDLKAIVDQVKSDCGFEFKKSIYFCAFKKDIKFLRTEFETRKEHGLDVKWLEENDLKKIGLNALAAIESKSGAVLDPYQLAQDLLHFCKEKGMLIFDRTDIISIKKKAEKMLAITNSDYTITAENIIHCTGYESVEMISNEVVDLKSTYVTISESYTKLPPLFKNAIYWNTADPYHYFRSTPDGRIIIGGGDEEFKDAERRDKLMDLKESYLLKQFKKYFPKIDFIPDYSWAGTFGETKDGLPYFGKLNPKKNEHFVLGFGGNGITFSVLGMNSIISSLENLPHPDLEYYKFGR